MAAPSMTVAVSALSWSFDTSGTAGGQHANKTSSRATLTLDLVQVAGPEPLLGALRDRFGTHLTVSCSEHRSQYRNRVACIDRLVETISEVAYVAPERIPTAVPAASHARTRTLKRRTAARKRDRRPPAREED